MRPVLSKDLNEKDFRNFYWLKEELQVFCRENGLSTSGSKVEITERIAYFLLTGKIAKPSRKQNYYQKSAKSKELSLNTIITEEHRCSQAVRAFFKSQIPKFHFSTHIQNYFKENVGKTYQEVIAAWYEEENRKKDPSYITTISSQFEYNQFTRDYFTDPENKGKKRKDAIAAWKEIKKLPGKNKYIPKSNS
ncbi:DUF6434 domain-containing protein [Lysinibacillus sphaericus]|uniref:DUF6434 domain-containing protein n=1 Tax=Lysinibacillus sphaericus TaxID=1421 RepID=UPI003D04138D